MTLTATKTVRELAVEIPNATRIFEKLKLDYCCGGNRSLAEACAVAGVDVETVIRLLQACVDANGQNGATFDFQTMSLTALMTHIVETHHVFTRQELERLSALLDKVCAVHGRKHPELLTIKPLLQELYHDLVPHMLKEEQVLFPYIERLEAAAQHHRPLSPPPFGFVGDDQQATVDNDQAVMLKPRESARHDLADGTDA